MNNQNNSYPIFTEEPLITENRQPQLGNSNSNNQYVPPPAYPQGGNIPPPAPYNGYNQNPNIVPANQVFVGNQGFNPNQNNQGFNPNQNQGFNPNQNQGFIPNNQGYNPNNQGFNPNNQGYIIKMICPVCRRDTDSFPRRVAGSTAYLWCFCLFLFTGILCCWLPFCIQGCQDQQVVCVICQCVKSRIPANCC